MRLSTSGRKVRREDSKVGASTAILGSNSPELKKLSDKLEKNASGLAALMTEIEEKNVEKATLTDIRDKIKKEIFRVREETHKAQKQSRQYENCRVRRPVSSSAGFDLSHQLENVKRTVIKLGDTVEKENKLREQARQDCERERENVEYLREIVKKMKNELALQKKDCDVLRRELQVSSKQMTKLKETNAKYVEDIKHFSAQAEHT